MYVHTHDASCGTRLQSDVLDHRDAVPKPTTADPLPDRP
jgi:hypothetical protein